MSADAVFCCLSCGKMEPHGDAQLDIDNNLVCGACYLLDPPQQDIDAAVSDVAERLRREHWAEMSRAYNRETESVCDTCGGRTHDGRCGHGCR
jgi:hypothetical protein